MIYYEQSAPMKLLSPEQLVQRLDWFNKTNDWTVFDDVPDTQQVNVLYPHYGFGYRAQQVKDATDPRNAMTIVNVTDRTAAAIMLIEAMTRESKNKDLLAKFHVPKIPLTHSSVEVKLTINGVEVDFLKTAQEMWERLVAHHEEHVLKEAKELVSRSKLDRLRELIENAEFEIEQELDTLFAKDKENG